MDRRLSVEDVNLLRAMRDINAGISKLPSHVAPKLKLANVKSMPPCKRQPVRLTALAPLLNSSRTFSALESSVMDGGSDFERL